jgi:DNA-binding CsgD family transcriptional regulator
VRRATDPRLTPVPTVLPALSDDSADFLGSLAERVGLCMARLDKNLQVLRANEYFHRQFGTCRGNLFGHSVYEFLHPKVHSRLRFQFGHLAEGRRTWFAERVVAVCPGVSVFESELTCIVGADRATGGPGMTVLFKTEPAQRVGEREVTKEDQLAELSARVLEHLATGWSTAEIATKLQLSRQGVEYHIGSMLRRFDVPNRAALISRAFSAGVLTGESWPPKVLVDFVR